MHQFDNLKLDHQLCFALYSASHVVMRAYRVGLEKFGLTYSQYLIMLTLWEQDDSTVSNIAKCLALDVGSITPVLKRLEVAGMLTRNRSKTDERVVMISLTLLGKGLQAKVSEVQSGVELQTGLSKAEFIKLKQALKQLTLHMNAGLPEDKD